MEASGHVFGVGIFFAIRFAPTVPLLESTSESSILGLVIKQRKWYAVTATSFQTSNRMPFNKFLVRQTTMLASRAEPF